MKVFFGLLLILIGMFFGVYVGFWVMFIGGILTVTEAVKSDPVNAWNLVWGALKIIFAGTIGGLTFYLFVLPGLVLLETSKDDSG